MSIVYTNIFYSTSSIENFTFKITKSILISNILLGYTNSKITEMYMKMFRLYKEGYAPGALVRNMFRKLDGAAYPELLYNLYLDSHYDSGYYIFPNKLTGKKYVSTNTSDGYQVVKVSSSDVNLTIQTPSDNSLNLCEPTQERNSYAGTCSYIFKDTNILATQISGKPTINVSYISYDFTIELWFYATNFQTMKLITLTPTINTGISWTITVLEKRIKVNIQNGIFVNADYNSPPVPFLAADNYPIIFKSNQWNYFILGVDSTNGNLYLNEKRLLLY
jgi:hypothetical protein